MRLGSNLNKQQKRPILGFLDRFAYFPRRRYISCIPAPPPSFFSGTIAARCRPIVAIRQRMPLAMTGMLVYSHGPQQAADTALVSCNRRLEVACVPELKASCTTACSSRRRWQKWSSRPPVLNSSSAHSHTWPVLPLQPGLYKL